MVRHRITTMLATALVPTALAASLAACGSQGDRASDAPVDSAYPGRSAQQILDASRSAAVEAKTVTLSGKATINGKVFTYTSSVANGKGEVDTVSLPEGTALFRRVGTAAFVSPDPQLITSAFGEATAKILAPKMAGKWLAVDQNGLPGIATYISDGFSFLGKYPTTGSPLESAVPKGATLTRVPGKEIGGVATTGIAFTMPMPSDIATQIAATGGQAPGTLAGTVLVASSGTPYPVAITSNAGLDMTLSGWDRPVKVGLPPVARTTTLQKIGLGAP